VKEELNKVVDSAKTEINNVRSMHDLMQLKSKYVGKKSILNSFMQKIGSLSKEERPAFGQTLNIAKNKISQMIADQEEKIKELDYETTLKSESIDLSMPGRKRAKGSLHPITKVWREIENIFMSMGFEVAEGPDVEDEYHNFDALNTPQDHPARELSDTFYLDDDVLLRTQTSTVQIRTMENHSLPIKIISPGMAATFAKEVVG